MNGNTEAALESVCEKLVGLKLILGISAAGVCLNLLWLPFVRPGTGTYVVVIMGLVVMLPFAVLSAVLLRICRRRQERERREVTRRHRRNR